MADTPAIDIKGLTKVYKETTALSGLDLTVPRNSIFGFLGPNGAGKSTTIKLLLGLISPTGGSARVFGLDIGKESLEIRRRVGYLSQDPRFYMYMTARETLRFTTRFFYDGPSAAIERRVNETLDLVGLADKADRPVSGFSGGERQRLGLGQAQVSRPDLLILDEPAASLDPQGRHDVLEVMERLREYATIFYSTHILQDVQRVSDTVAILDHGSLVARAPIEQLLAGGGQAAYEATVRGDARRAETILAKQPWVAGVETVPHNGVFNLVAAVTDEAAAEAQLLRLILADESLSVTKFGRRNRDLEEVFLGLTGGVNHEH